MVFVLAQGTGVGWTALNGSVTVTFVVMAVLAQIPVIARLVLPTLILI